jgi:hypothetical protein
MTVCDNSRRKDEKTGMVYQPCIDKIFLTKVDAALAKQCELYSRIAPLFKDVKSPRDVMENGKIRTCDKDTGIYREKT